MSLFYKEQPFGKWKYFFMSIPMLLKIILFGNQNNSFFLSCFFPFAIDSLQMNSKANCLHKQPNYHWQNIADHRWNESSLKSVKHWAKGCGALGAISENQLLLQIYWSSAQCIIPAYHKMFLEHYVNLRLCAELLTAECLQDLANRQHWHKNKWVEIS